MLQMFRSWLKSTKKVTAAGRHSKHGKSGSKPLGLEVLESRLNPAASLPANYHVVENLYNGLMNRVSDLPGKAYWVRQLDLGASVAVVAREMQDSTEYRRQTVESYYQAFLDRPSDAPGLKAFVSAARSASEEDLIARFVSSQEYSGGPATTPQNYVDTLYQTLLYRQGDETGINSQIAALARGASRYDVAFAMVRSLEFYTGQVVAAYKSTLGRTPSPWESSGWAASLYEGKLSLPGMRAGIYGSPEAFKQLKTPKAFTPDTSVTWKADQIGLTGRESAGLSPAVKDLVGGVRTVVYLDTGLLKPVPEAAAISTGRWSPGFTGPASALGVGSGSVVVKPSDDDFYTMPYPNDNPSYYTPDITKAAVDTSNFKEVNFLPALVAVQSSRETVDKSTISHDDVITIQPYPTPADDIKWTRVFDLLERLDSQPVTIVVDSDAPTAPTGLKLTPDKVNDRLLIEWNPVSPSAPANPIFYIVKIVSQSGSTTIVVTGETQMKINNLKNLRDYVISVVASNSTKSGNPCEPVPIVAE